MLLLSHRYTQCLPGCINTTAVTETMPSFFTCIFGQIFLNRDIDMLGHVLMRHFRHLDQPSLLDSVMGWKNHTTRRAPTNTPEGGFIHIERG